MNNFELGLLLMAVGMATVFAILLLVIGFGKGLILLVNKYAPEEITIKTSRRVAVAEDGALPRSTAAAIVSAVSVLTGGQGKVTKIEKK
ncbi:MAG: OadG family protein [Tannerella sp.]|jgi:oxaloacetate decarboxylase gamma subunit|nr:OadG family protein [Tannerella sp.]